MLLRTGAHRPFPGYARAVNPRIVLHADMDAFYASIEQRDQPELRGKPVIVGATSRRGVVAAASYEAREFGVRSAMPGFRAHELCPHGVFLRSDMKKYVAVSGQIHRVFQEFTPLIEPLALDEAFLDISGSLNLFGGSPLELARRLKQRVRDETQLAVSCGVATSKLVAKIACRLSKPDGLRWVPADQTRALLDPLPLRWLWGVGPVTEAQLEALGFRTLGDLARADVRTLRASVGERAPALIALARGEDDRPVEADREAKSYGEENTFERDISDRDTVTRALTSHAQAVARRLRHDHLEGRTVTIRIKLGRKRKTQRARSERSDSAPDYPLLTRSKTLPRATDDGALIRRVAIDLWDAAAIAEPVRLLGVALSQLAEKNDTQLDLFSTAPDVRQTRLGPALDDIRKRFGDEAIKLGIDDPEKLTPSTRKKRGV
jgi:DNA polymerase-4